MATQGNAGFSNLVCADPQQLQPAVADISKALDEALRKNGIQAMLHLRRAGEIPASAAPAEISPTHVPGPRLTAWQRRRVLEHIETSLAEPLRNRDLAALVGYSEFHFIVAFRNALGTPPHEYVIRRRIERARQLMVSSDLTLCQIAVECGLADQSHLSRLFRKVVGDTPAAWRRNQFAGAAWVEKSPFQIERITGEVR
jgi:transcriptional regulator GlxA family with amidase domain